MNFSDIIWFMNSALSLANKAYNKGEVPVGAIITSADGKTLSSAHNLKENNNNPCGHAEIYAIIDATKKISNWRLTGANIFVTLEPCTMCLAAMVQARINHLYFGAYDMKGGALSLGYNLYKDTRLNHNFSVTGGIKNYECSKIISQFFRERRKDYKRKTKTTPDT